MQLKLDNIVKNDKKTNAKPESVRNLNVKNTQKKKQYTHTQKSKSMQNTKKNDTKNKTNA